MIKCKANPKKDDVNIRVKGSNLNVAVEMLAVVRAVVTDVLPKCLRWSAINSIRNLLDELESAENDEENADNV